jgi:hypothetical protein
MWQHRILPICRPYGTSPIFNIPSGYRYVVPTGLGETWSYAADMHGYSSSPQNLGWKFSRYNCSEARVIAV